METKLKGYWEKAKTLLGKVSKKIWILTAVALVLVIALVVIFSSNREYAVLVTGVSSEEASSIMSYLDSLGATDYRWENNDTILVPAGQEVALKAKIIMEGYPRNGFTYSTYYDHVSALSTESERNAAYLQDLQDRMGAVIRCFDGVKEAGVTITPGTDRTYVLDSGNRVEASASVIITMQEGMLLTDQQATAIRHLLAHSVQGLEIGAVKLSDTRGNMYSTDAGLESSSDSSALKLLLEEKYNNLIRSNVMLVLVPLFGEDNVKVGVNCTVDVNKTIEDNTDVYLPDFAQDGSTNGEGIIGSKIYDDFVVRGDDETPGGVVGANSNSDLSTYIEDNLNPDGNERQIGTSGQVDYDNPRSEKHIERTAGYLSDCMVAVTINSDVAAGGVDVDQLQNLVARAAGISDDTAANRISIYSGSFFDGQNGGSELLGPDNAIPMWVIYAAAGGLLFFLLALLLILIIRKKRKKKKAELEGDQQAVEEILSLVQLPEAEPAGADVMSLKSEKSMELRRDIRKFADENPEVAAKMVRILLKGEESDG